VSVRKNFVFDDDVTGHLEEIAKIEKRYQTVVVEELIEKRYRSRKIEKHLEAYERMWELADCEFSGLFKEKTIQSIKADMDV